MLIVFPNYGRLWLTPQLYIRTRSFSVNSHLHFTLLTVCLWLDGMSGIPMDTAGQIVNGQVVPEILEDISAQ